MIARREADLDEIVATVPVLSFGMFGHEADELARVAHAIESAAEARVLADTFSAGHGINVAPAGLSKWTGVLAYCEHHGVDPARVLAIGDETNDVELLSRAAVGLAMADGHADARAAADHLVPPSAEGGWAALLDHL